MPEIPNPLRHQRPRHPPIHHRTPPVPLTLLLHLGGDSLWVNCDQPYLSSTYRPARCGSALCSLAASTACGDCFSTPRPTPGCNNNTCGIFPYNPITSTSTSGELATDVISLNSTDGSNPGPSVSVPRFLFACAPSFLTRGLAPPSAGVAGLGIFRPRLVIARTEVARKEESLGR
ncbi:unnamed protein product [Linum tenue]|uniref:Xylanase inhibitor N-terminal domain-containing protein n=1 Tax=Linum tenue TaxID=586396 RepID=A0AAV0NZB2_9ROSI|nr:unnamed protein product [Linum tenue]